MKLDLSTLPSMIQLFFLKGSYADRGQMKRGKKKYLITDA